MGEIQPDACCTVSMEHSHILLFMYYLWPISEVWPKKTKYFLSSLLQKNSTNPFYTPLVTFNYYSVFAKHPRHNSDNLYDYYLSFFSLASLLLIAIQDFATLVLMFLGLSSSITIKNVLLGALRTGTHFTRA